MRTMEDNLHDSLSNIEALCERDDICFTRILWEIKAEVKRAFKTLEEGDE